MQTQNILLGAVAALTTTTLTLTVLWPHDLQASNPRAAVKKEITTPSMTVQGCTVVLTSNIDDCKPGSRPVISLRLTNPTDKPVTLKAQLAMTAQAPGSPLSRRMVRPRQLWSTKKTYTVPAGKSILVSVQSTAKAPKGQTLTVRIGIGKRTLLSQGVDPVLSKLLQKARKVNNLRDQRRVETRSTK